VARADSRAAWHGGEKIARLGEGGGAGRGRHVARPSASQGRRGRSTWLAERRRRGAEKNRGGGREVDEEGLKSNIPKILGPYCNVPVTFKPELN
jgi:hypothetical protein